MPEDEFIKFRLKQGVYGQRQADVKMIRVKLPFGGVTPEQMESFADVDRKVRAAEQGPHHDPAERPDPPHPAGADAEPAIRELGESGLSSREGCGNTVRNVTGDPWAGVAKDELFDMTPYAGAYVRYFVRHPTTQAMPRKIKTSFDGSPRDRAISGIHDIAFRARTKEIEGRGTVRGAEMLVGGGTSIMPRVAPALYEFVELDNGEYLKLAEAVFRIFDRQDWLRQNRARARIKVFVDKFGIDELRNQVEEELQGRLGRRTRLLDRGQAVPRRRARGRARPARAVRQPERRPERVRTLPPGERERAEAGGLRDGRGESPARRPHARAVPRSGGGDARLRRRLRAHDRPAELRAALGARGERLRPLARALGARPRRAGLARDHRRRLLPGDGLVQARDHELDGAQPGGAGADRRDGHHRRDHTQAERQDLAAARTAAASTTSPRSASPARRSKSASTRSPPTSPTSAACSKAARSSSARA